MYKDQIEKGRARLPSSNLLDRVKKILKSRPNSASRTTTPVATSKIAKGLNTSARSNSQAKLRLFEKFSSAWQTPPTYTIEAELFLHKIHSSLQRTLAPVFRQVCKVDKSKRCRQVCELAKARCYACGYIGLDQLTTSTKENLSPKFTEHISMLFVNEKLLKTQHFEAKFASSVTPTETKISDCFVQDFQGLVGMPETYHDRRPSGFHNISFISKRSDANESPQSQAKDIDSVRDAESSSKHLRSNLSIDLDRGCAELQSNFSVLLESPEEYRIRRRPSTTTPTTTKPRNYPRLTRAVQALALLFARKIHQAFDTLASTTPRVSLTFDLSCDDSFHNGPSTGTFRAREPSNSSKAACRIMAARLDKFAYRRKLVGFLKLHDFIFY